MVLPNGTSVDEQTVAKICGIIQEVVASAEAVKVRLGVDACEHGSAA
jgi:hypothetical protein